MKNHANMNSKIGQGLLYFSNLTHDSVSEHSGVCGRQRSTGIVFSLSNLIFLYYSLFHLCSILIYHNSWCAVGLISQYIIKVWNYTISISFWWLLTERLLSNLILIWTNIREVKFYFTGCLLRKVVFIKCVVCCVITVQDSASNIIDVIAVLIKKC